MVIVTMMTIVPSVFFALVLLRVVTRAPRRLPDMCYFLGTAS